MNIKQTVLEILESDAYRKALDGEGDKDLEILLISFGHHIYDKVRFNMVRCYGKCRFFQTEHIKSTLNDVPPPENLQLNTRLK